MNNRIHMIGNAHLDPVWLWRWQEGYAEIKATFRSALDRLDEFPDFIFTCAGAAYYRWIEENAPGMFGEIRRRVAEGRWVIVGGWWIQPDCNLPAGESFARHSLYSQRYFQEKFAVTATVGYNVDSFGHTATLPQILRQSGMDRYVFMRPQQHEKELDANLFWWESPDGSRVLTFRIPVSYMNRTIGELDDKLKETIGLAERQQLPHMCFYGVGNHGGGPTIANLQYIHRLQSGQGGERIVMSSPDRYFAEAEQSARAEELPVLRDDLFMHAIGCYSAHSETKASNRKAEHRLMTAEKIAALAHALTGLDYPGERLQHAWHNVLFNQFHDILGGCSIKEAYDDAREGYGEALNIGAVALNAGMQKISWSIDTTREGVASLGKDSDWLLWEQNDAGVPFVVFNPLSWDVTAPVVVNKHVRTIEDDQGRALPIQLVRSSRTDHSDKWDTLFMANVPAFGYSVFWIYKNKESQAAVQPASLAAGEHWIENGDIRIELDPAGGHIASLLDKRTGAQVLAGSGAVPQVLDEEDSDTWSHGMRAFTNVIGQFGQATLQLVEQGPLRATIRVTSRYGRSVLRQDVTVYHDRADVQVKAKLDWREEHKLLKLVFPVHAASPVATYDAPYGHMVRPVNGEENPGLQWVDVSSGSGSGGDGGDGVGDGRQPEGGACGLALLNDGKYSFDVNGHVLRMTVVRGALFADHFGERDGLGEFMDQGIQEFAYSVVPHAGSWQQAGVVRKAFELNTPLPSVIETYHQGHLPQTFTGAAISSGHIAATVFKRAEDGGGYVLRCYETEGRATGTDIALPALGRSWTAHFGKNEMKTFYIPQDKDAPVAETNLLEHTNQHG